MDKDDDLIDYNDVYPEDLIAGRTQGTLNKGDGTSSDPEDWSFDDEQKAQSQAKYGDSIFYEPFTPKPPRGSVEDIQHRLRIAGIRLRKDLNRSLLTDPQAWTALRRPASLHSAQRTLAEMLVSIPSADQEHFHELGDGYAYMPLHAMDKCLYPTLRVMQHLLTQRQGPIRLHPRWSRVDDSVLLLPSRRRIYTKSNRTRPQGAQEYRLPCRK
jgi:hypothetical protein